MGNSVYHINKGINNSIEFKGLKSQYIWYLGVAVMILLIVFAILYFLGINSFLSLGIIAILGTYMVIKIYSLSNKYGEHGMMKKLAKRMIPKVVKSKSRRVFMDLKITLSKR